MPASNPSKTRDHSYFSPAQNPVYLGFLALCLVFPSTHLSASPTGAEAESFTTVMFAGDRGILAGLTFDPATGQLGDTPELFSAPGQPVLQEMVESGDSKFLAVLDRQNEARSFFVFERESGGLKSTRIEIPQRAVRMAIEGGLLAVAGHGGSIFQVQLSPAQVLREVPIREIIKPKGPQISAIQFSPDKATLVILMRDETPGPHGESGRVVLASWPELKVKSDLRIPALYPNLHYGAEPAKDSVAATGIHMSGTTNTVSLLIENYGGILLADLDKFLAGEIANSSFIPVSASGREGEAFPTAQFPFEFQNRPFLAVDSGTTAGGLTFIDLKSRKRVARAETGPTSMAFFGVLGGEGRAFASRGGLVMHRGAGMTESKHSEQDQLVLLDLKPLLNGESPLFEIVSFESNLYWTANLGPGNDRHILLGLFAKKLHGDLELGVYDAVEKKLIDRKPSPGVLRGIKRNPKN